MTSTTTTPASLAQTPPMGWNSWDCFGSSVTEDEVLANAEFMATHLRAHGWRHVVVDIQWYEPEAGEHDYNAVSAPLLDEFGRQLPAPNRFPSAAQGRGFAPLAERVHALGLEFGVHMMRGIPRAAVEQALPVKGTDATAADIADRDNTCPWNPDNYGVDMTHPAGQAWYDSQIELFASWGVDFVKLDDVLYPPVQRAEIEAYHRAIEKCGRPMALSLSPGKQLSLAHQELLASNAEMWRISDDLWDDWSALLEMFQRCARWAPHQRPGAWADADMLPIGRLAVRAHVGTERDSRLSLEEQRTMVSLWCLARSPLMVGGHLPASRPESIALLTNDAVLRVLNESRESREIVRDHELVVWAAELDDQRVRGVFWLGEEPTRLRVHADDLGVAAGDATDLWGGEVVTHDHGWLELDVPAHGVRLLGWRG